MREYEFTVIARGDLPEAEILSLHQKYEDLLTKDGGEILSKDVWGHRRMAFPINKCYKGFYTNYDYTGKQEHLIEVERLMRFDDNVLRYMSLKIADDVDPAKRKDQIAKERAIREAKARERSDDFGF